MRTPLKWPLIIGSAALVGLALIACSVVLFGSLALSRWGFVGMTGWRMPMMEPGQRFFGRRFASNGERIYFTATSESGRPITADMDMGGMSEPMMSCATCHGADGRGGRVTMMMGTFVAPDIRYRTLTTEEHGEGHEEHPPYDDELIKRAITEGLDPAGEPLEWPMPRWRMSERDLNDLLEFLKTLD